MTWPEELAERYRREGYWRGLTLGEAFRDWARARPAATALVAGARRWTYAELDHAADRMAAGLAARGIEPGDRIVVHLPNTAEFVLVLLGAVRLGALPILALPAHRSAEIVHLCRHGEAAAYVAPASFGGFDYLALADQVRSEVRQVLVAGPTEDLPSWAVDLAEVDAEPRDLPRPDPGAPALLLLSGGTTGLPKLIPRTHDDYLYNARVSAQLTGLGPHSVYLASLPVAHNFPLASPGALGTWSEGGTVVLARSPGPPETFPLIEREGVTHTALVPALALLWMEAAAYTRRDLSSLTLLQVGGSRIKDEDARRVTPALGCALQQAFGMAEGLICFTRLDDPEHIVHTTQGSPVCPDDEIRVVSPDGADVPDGEVGELLVRGPYTIRGYYRAAEHNATAFTTDGFYRTGDLVSRTPSGQLVVQGRVKDTIIRAGENVSAEEVEAGLCAHPAVREAAVVSLTDPAMGELVCAAVVFGGPPVELSELRDFLRHRGLAEFKLPERLAVLGELPLTAIGKYDKKRLQARIGQD
ncbi:(2,3-dihydroxybenzoyl)adenylate synthase [Pseudonocardia acaciae]|uniref:(2,3-dihydroxybenzoyl)adenylate synthase n=1 Tax=Pseudonocardia acaciae TaxID=551276 RepID=UPI00048A8DD4|nr:AMP-binding protein [Pseudonocardia acaciae]